MLISKKVKTFIISANVSVHQITIWRLLKTIVGRVARRKPELFKKKIATHLQFEEARWINRRLLGECPMDRQDQNRIFDLNKKKLYLTKGKHCILL